MFYSPRYFLYIFLLLELIETWLLWGKQAFLIMIVLWALSFVRDCFEPFYCTVWIRYAVVCRCVLPYFIRIYCPRSCCSHEKAAMIYLILWTSDTVIAGGVVSAGVCSDSSRWRAMNPTFSPPQFFPTIRVNICGNLFFLAIQFLIVGRYGWFQQNVVLFERWTRLKRKCGKTSVHS